MSQDGRRLKRMKTIYTVTMNANPEAIPVIGNVIKTVVDAVNIIAPGAAALEVKKQEHTSEKQ